MNTIKYKHFYKTESADEVAKVVAEKIRGRLDAGQKVLWLISGGSAAEVAVQAAAGLVKVDLSRLSIGLVDERYGSVGHFDSNWQHLINAGFRVEGARLHPVLNGRPAEATASDYRKVIDECFNSVNYTIALLGVGADSHTAGVLPASPAIDAQETVIAYKGPDFMRITLTLKGLLRLDEAVVYAAGEAKRQALEALTADKNLSIGQYPARVIRRIPEWSVYNDLVGEDI